MAVSKVCSNCIMDTSDPTITFDGDGVCSYCRNFFNVIKPYWHADEEGLAKIAPLIDRIKKQGAKRDHDCLIGISGGLDSTYIAYSAVKRFGLRPLLFHVDAGWNTDVAVSNIQKLVDVLRLDLVTHVVNWEEMKDLQRAFFKSGVPAQDTPQDVAFFSALFNFANDHGFKYIITGGNHSTECIRECLDWTYFTTDLTQLRDIHKRFGEVPLRTFPLCDILKYKIYYRYIKGVRVVKLLDSQPYVKAAAMVELQNEIGWTPYQMKHYESRLSRFLESYWYPRKHGFDKRRAYFSSEVLSGQLDRAEALERIAVDELDEATMQDDFRYVASKLGWKEEELREIFNSPNKSFRDYRHKLKILRMGATLSSILGIERRVFK